MPMTDPTPHDESRKPHRAVPIVHPIERTYTAECSALNFISKMPSMNQKTALEAEDMQKHLDEVEARGETVGCC